MKRLFFFFAFSLSVFAQINPNEFPKIGFADLFWLQYFPVYYNNKYNPVNYVSQYYYYPKLQELGLNYVVTIANPIGPLNSNHNSTIKVIDNDFRAFEYGPPYPFRVTGYNLCEISRATGNDPLFYAYECGGDGYADPSIESHKFGFGAQVVGDNAWKYSFWLRNRDNTIGDPNKSDYIASTNTFIRTFYAGVNEHSAGYILHGEFHPLHQNTYHGHSNYYLTLRNPMRIVIFFRIS